jgi:hypothetical protein
MAPDTLTSREVKMEISAEKHIANSLLSLAEKKSER